MDALSNQAFIDNFPSVFFRAVGVVTILPVGPAGVINRVVLALGMACMFSSAVPSTSPHNILIPIEFIIGVIIGLPFTMIVSLIELFGELCDAGRGQTIAHIYDPLHGETQNVSAVYLKNLALATLALLGIFEYVIRWFAKSLELVPPGAFDLSLLAGQGMVILKYCVTMLGDSFSMFLPLGLAYLFVDQTFGFISKTLNGISLTPESFQVKSFITFLVLGSFAAIFPALLNGLITPTVQLLVPPPLTGP